MILIQTSREDMADAARVAASARLDNVFLTSIQATNNIIKGNIDPSVGLDAKISHRYIGHKIQDQKTVFVEIGAKIELRIKQADDQKEEDPQPVIVIDVAYGVTYKLPNSPIPPGIGEKAFASFARINGLYNCWPYLRQEIQQLAAAMNFPFVLPTLRIEAEPKQKSKEDQPKQVKTRKTIAKKSGKSGSVKRK